MSYFNLALCFQISTLSHKRPYSTTRTVPFKLNQFSRKMRKGNFLCNCIFVLQRYGCLCKICWLYPFQPLVIWHNYNELSNLSSEKRFEIRLYIKTWSRGGKQNGMLVPLLWFGWIIFFNLTISAIYYNFIIYRLYSYNFRNRRN